MHEAFEFLLNRLAPSSQVGSDVLGEVLARVSEKAPHEVSRKEIALAKSRPNRPPAREIPQGTVSKAVKALLHEGLIEDGDTVLWSQEGRVLAPLRLGRRYVIAGVEITLHDGQPVTITTVLTGLDGTLLLAKVARLDPDETRWHALAGLVYDEVASLQRDYERQCRRQNRRSPGLFGVGVEIGAHVHDGSVVRPPRPEWPIAVPLGDHLSALFAHRCPVVIENDVNALAVLATHDLEYAEPDLVVVAVLDEGVGGGLVMDGRLRRGGKGMAMEIGHLTVGYPAGTASHSTDDLSTHRAHPSLQGFDPCCPCGSLGHLDAFATPARIRAALGVSTLTEAACSPATTPAGTHCREYEVFYAAGAMLGRGLAHIVNIVNPSRLIIWLPQDLVGVPANLAGAAYLEAVTAEIKGAYSTGADNTVLTLKTLPAENTAELGATAAARCVLDCFIDHARGLDGCHTPQRRISRERAS